MKIIYRETGGFAGLTKSVEIDLDSLPSEEAAALRSMVEKAKFFTIVQPAEEPMPDAIQRFITVEEPSRSRTIHLSREVPVALEPLVKELARRAKYEKRERPTP
jgi:hypothetical protein